MANPLIERVHSNLRRVVAPNPSPMTFKGTNTYVIGTGQVAIVDPGPENDAHLDAILETLDPGESVSHILVTHSHMDHSPLARSLSDKTSAPVYAFGPTHAGRSDFMSEISIKGGFEVSEGLDLTFTPDFSLCDGQTISAPTWAITAVHTPGHLSNHLTFLVDDFALTGDHVMGWSSTMIAPPDGDLTQFMASCEKLLALRLKRLFPGHGDPISEPEARLNWLIDHRNGREREILNALSKQSMTASELTREIYSDLDMRLLGAARNNVIAHLLDLLQRNRVRATPEPSANALFSLV